MTAKRLRSSSKNGSTTRRQEGLPLLLEAAGRCPPEDVGGAPGYAQYLDAIRDPTVSVALRPF
ncbi:hypothetical protein [Bradyrhizobium sp. S3.2.12]|uniref:IS1096 element passenger TnpR family protein n=1 Tax=Bradyrhizobium sp. S3.2.12 TaxID=3156387 RepID=UPI0033936605